MADDRAGRQRGGWWWAAGVIVAVAMVLGFADILGVARVPIIAGVLGPRNALTIAAGVGALVALAVSLIRPVRFVALPLAVALAVTTAISAPIVLARGVANTQPALSGQGQLRILSWNTNGDLVAPQTIAAEATSLRANVIVLPAIDEREKSAVVDAFASRHLAMVASSVPGDEVLVLTDASLGRRDTTGAGEPVGSQTLVLHPDDKGQPALVALHADQPTLRGNAAWRDELAWVADECSRGDAIVAGDFNATLDELGDGGLGACRDAAAVVHAGSVGSWPTAVPTWLAMPLDHILVTPDWQVDSFTVLTDADGSGARHRPVFAVLSRR
ncbi:endonuclease/exonuclease/phosphatase family protein [Diaminobutyricibacter sp. McL0618]|uniref:endonuclease/exonuclease/phosphatase family protein n=1 Tax=Leifsonia sp. McL0618 TaxID=3415677 RepID=UPI003CF4E35D